MAARQLKRRDLALLQKHLLTKARSCVHPPGGLLKHTFVIPSYDMVPGADDESDTAERSTSGAYLQMYDWDACFFAQTSRRAGLPPIAFAVVQNFLAQQDKSGFIPRTVSPGRIWDKGDICKPFLSQTLVGELAAAGWRNGKQVEEMLPGLERYLRYFLTHRRHALGLFSWRNVLESGVDDNYALLAPKEAQKDENQKCVRYPDGRLLAVDLNTYLVCEFRAFARLASFVKQVELAREFRRLANDLHKRIETLLWDRQLGMYVNFDPKDGTSVRLRSWTGLMPVLFALTKRRRALSVVRRNILNEKHFLRPFGIASMAASEPLSNQSPRGLYGRAIVCSWNGPVWVLPNVLTVRALSHLGLKDAAKEVAQRCLKALILDLKTNGVLHENYNADSGAALWAPKFMSWNIMALEMIEQARNQG